MKLRRFTAGVGTLAAAVAAVMMIGTPAHADDRVLDHDSVFINEVGFDLGSGSYNNVELSGTAPLDWLVDENNVTAHLTGTLHLAGVNGVCARIRIDYYTSATVFLTTKYGGTVCAPDNGWHGWSVDQSQYTSDKTGKVKVSIEEQLPDNSWAIAGSDWATLNTYIDDTVKVAESVGGGVWGIGFGSNSWSNGNPIGYGEVAWNMSGGQITPHLTGYLHMESAAAQCTRMHIEYYSDDGPDAGTDDDYLTTVHGGTVCALDNAHHVWSVDRDDYSGSNIRKVKVCIDQQQSENSWLVIDCTTSFFGTAS